MPLAIESTNLLKPQMQEICDNGIDDDGDGKIDCFDEDCCGNLLCATFWYQPCKETCLPINSDQLGAQSMILAEEFSNQFEVLTGDLDGDGFSEIISKNQNGSAIIVFDPATGTSNLIPEVASSIALGEVTQQNSGREIIINIGTAVKVFSKSGQAIWTTNVPGSYTAEISVADLNQDGQAEIVLPNNILDGQSGNIVLDVGGLAYDFYPDDECLLCTGLELISNDKIIALDLNTRDTMTIQKLPTIPKSQPTAHPIPINWDNQAGLELVYYTEENTSNFVNVWSSTTESIIHKQFLISNPGISPAIGDLNNDLLPEMIVVLANGAIMLLSNNLTQIWRRGVREPTYTRAIIFDIENDNLPEIIYRDARELMILDGLTGDNRYIINCQSGTAGENVIVADFDLDGEANIITVCGDDLVSFYSDDITSWAPARPVWNQFHYFNTHVNDNLTIPQFQQSSDYFSDEINSFLLQYSPTANLDLQLEEVITNCDSISLSFCNVEQRVFNDSLSVSIYNHLSGYVKTLEFDKLIITPDSCLVVSKNNLNIDHGNYIAVINDKGRPGTQFFIDSLPQFDFEECKYKNNYKNFSIIDTASYSIVSTEISCNQWQLEGPAGLSNFKWSTGESSAIITVSQSGIYSVTGMDSCQNEHLEETVVQLSPCNGQEICDNGIDDDGDGLIDCFDEDCCGQFSCEDFWYDACVDTTCIFQGGSQFEINGSPIPAGNQFTGYSTVMAGDVNADGIAEVIASSIDGSLQVINAQSGQTLTTITPGFLGFLSFGIGDITNASVGAEIVVYNGLNIQAYSYEGNLIWEQPNIDFTNNISFADFNQDGQPEVYTENSILNGQNGEILIKINGIVSGIGNVGTACAVDIFDDNNCADCQGLEFIADSRVFAVNLTTGTNALIADYSQSMNETALNVVLDWNQDGLLDIVSYGLEKTNIWSPYDLSTLASFNRSTASKGLPNIGDIDGDGFPEMVYVDGFNDGSLIAVDNDMSVLWMNEVQDRSGFTGVTLFDFNQDGKMEVVYRDEENLNIIDGETGNGLDLISCKSATGSEYPIVVDIDNDMEANILIVCSEETLGSTGQIYNFSSGPNTKWASARPVWNQINYFNVHVNDDLSIPRVQQNHHIPTQDLNSFLNQYSPPEFIELDLEVRYSILDQNDCKSVSIEICNIGTEDFNDSIYVSVYETNSNLLINLSKSNLSLGISECTQVLIALDFSDTIEHFGVIINDAGISPNPFIPGMLPNTSILECDYQNNMLNSIEVNREMLIEIGIDSIISFCDTAQIIGTEGDFEYLWSDGSSNQIIEVFQSGSYNLTITDPCGNMAIDSITILLEPCKERIFHYVLDTLCLGDSLFFNQSFLSKSGTYLDTFITNQGNDSIVQLDLNILEEFNLTLPDTITVNADENFNIEIEGKILPDMVFMWQFDGELDCNDCPNPVLSTTIGGMATLIIQRGICDTTLQTIVNLNLPSEGLYIPNIFSPNGDGNNDQFVIFSSVDSQVDFSIFDRWGNAVYYFKGLLSELTWDGTNNGQALDPAVFVYKLNQIHQNRSNITVGP